MKTLIVTSIVAAVAGGAVGGFVVTGASGESGSIAAVSADDVRELKSQIADLARVNDDLRVRLDVLETKPTLATPERVPTADVAVPAAALEPELRALATSLRDPDAPLPDNFRANVAQVIADVKKQEEKQRDDERAKREQERFEQRMTEMVTELKLTPYQSNEMRKTLTAEEAKRDAMRDSMRDGGDFQSMRESWEKLRTDTKTELAKYLTNEQIATYDEKFANPFGRGRRGFGGQGGFFGGGAGTPGGGAGGTPNGTNGTNGGN